MCLTSSELWIVGAYSHDTETQSKKSGVDVKREESRVRRDASWFLENSEELREDAPFDVPEHDPLVRNTA